jgi:hypothetical protein
MTQYISWREEQGAETFGTYRRMEQERIEAKNGGPEYRVPDFHV